MTRYPKTLGPFLAAVFAIGVLAAPAASGSDAFKAAEGTILTGHGEDNEFKFTTPGLGVHCWNATFAGTISEPEKVTVLPTYKGKKGEPENTICESLIGIVRVDMNGCDYVLTGNTTQEDGGKADAEVSIVCPEGKAIRITNNCEITIPGQTPTGGGVTYVNGTENGKGDVTINQTLTGLKFTAKGVCSLVGIPNEGSNLDLVGTMTVTGYENTCEVGKCPINGDEFKEGAQVSIEVA